jgi:hypothetical protein
VYLDGADASTACRASHASDDRFATAVLHHNARSEQMASKNQPGKSGKAPKSPSKSGKPSSNSTREQLKDLDVSKEMAERVRGGRMRHRTLSDT